jgi:hypothetical protein
MKYRIKDKDYLELWKYFQDKASSVKGAMFNTITWLIGFQAGLLGFILSKQSNFNPCYSSISLSLLTFSLSFAGIILFIFSLISIHESKKHIKNNWESADKCLWRIENLDLIVKHDRKKTFFFDTFHIWNQLLFVQFIFGLAFLCIMVWQLIKLI